MRMKKLSFCSAAALILALITGFVHHGTASEDPNEDLRKVVEVFCRLDLDGGLLSTENSKRSGIFDYISLSEGPFPAWDTVTLVEGYEVLSVSSRSDAGEVLLRYDVIGEIPGAAELVIKKRKEETRFRLRRINGMWKIIDPNDLLPHISVETAINHLHSLVDSGGNDQPEVPLVIEKLRKLK
jgi:hypothetical protein